MPRRPRSVRITLPGARGELAETRVQLVNLSRTGALMRARCNFWPGSVWPFVLDLPMAALSLTARVVRCELADAPSVDAGTAVEYLIAVTFDQSSVAARDTLADLCGTAIERGDTPAAGRTPGVTARERRRSARETQAGAEPGGTRSFNF